jgi:hypothetical protein
MSTPTENNHTHDNPTQATEILKSQDTQGKTTNNIINQAESTQKFTKDKDRFRCTSGAFCRMICTTNVSLAV